MAEEDEAEEVEVNVDVFDGKSAYYWFIMTSYAFSLSSFHSPSSSDLCFFSPLSYLLCVVL